MGKINEETGSYFHVDSGISSVSSTGSLTYRKTDKLRGYFNASCKQDQNWNALELLLGNIKAKWSRLFRHKRVPKCEPQCVDSNAMYSSGTIKLKWVSLGVVETTVSTWSCMQVKRCASELEVGGAFEGCGGSNKAIWDEGDNSEEISVHGTSLR